MERRKKKIKRKNDVRKFTNVECLCRLKFSSLNFERRIVWIFVQILLVFHKTLYFKIFDVEIVNSKFGNV